MGLLDRIFGATEIGPYRTEAQQKANKQTQVQMTPQTLEVLREHGVGVNTRLRLEFFFYTNSSEKAARLSNELSGMGYTSDYGASAGSRKDFLVNGWSTPIRMDEASAVEWTESMCDLAAKHDCEFDGWGTNPAQAE